MRNTHSQTVVLVLNAVAVHGVERVGTIRPWERAGGEATVEEVDSIGHDHSVVKVDDGGNEGHAVAQAAQGRGQPTVDLDSAEADVLSQGQFHEEGRNGHHKQHDDVGQEKCPTTILQSTHFIT